MPDCFFYQLNILGFFSTIKKHVVSVQTSITFTNWSVYLCKMLYLTFFKKETTIKTIWRPPCWWPILKPVLGLAQKCPVANFCWPIYLRYKPEVWALNTGKKILLQAGEAWNAYGNLPFKYFVSPCRPKKALLTPSWLFWIHPFSVYNRSIIKYPHYSCPSY